jgi:hypothetical protein
MAADASPRRTRLVGVTGVEGGISSDVQGKGVEHGDGLDVQRYEVGDVIFIEGLGELSQHDIPIDGISGWRDTGAVAPDEFLFFGGGAFRIFLISVLFDAAFGNRGRLWAAGVCGSVRGRRPESYAL